MDYGVLIRRAWHLTWRNSFLWVLGLFATSTVGSCSPTAQANVGQFRPSQVDIERLFSSDLARSFQHADPLLSRNIGWFLLAIFVVGFLIVVAFLIVSFIAQGGMAEATIELGLRRVADAGGSWTTGLQKFWRYLLLWLLLVGLGVVVAAVVAIVVGILIAIGVGGQGPARTTVALIGALFGLLGLIVGVPILLGVSVVVGFAQRAIVLEDAGPWRALTIGARLVWRNLGTSAIAWLISLALSLGVGLGVALVAVALLIPLGAAGAAIFLATGSVVSIPLAGYAVVALVALVAGLWFLGGIANAYFWSYWSLVYLRLTGRLNEQLEPPA